MSWGFFVELTARLDSDRWGVLKDMTPGTVSSSIPEGWPAAAGDPFNEHVRADALLSSDRPFSEILAGQDFHREAVHDLDVGPDTTTLRILVLWDRSRLACACFLVALLEAVRQLGGAGTLSLVNDGTFAGPEGWVHTVAEGRWSREDVTDCWAYSEGWGEELWS